MPRGCWLIAVIVGLQIYPTPWNAVKAAYIFCRYYPMVIAPFHLWGIVGDHEQRICESYYHALFLPVRCPRYARSYLPWNLSSGFEYRCYQHNVSAFRSTCFICCYSHLYLPCPKSFSCCGHTRSLGEKDVLAILLVAFFSLVGVIIWVTSKEITRLSWRLCFSMYIPDSSVASQCRSFLFPPNATPVLLFRINRLWTHYWRLLRQMPYLSPSPITWECVYDFSLVRLSDQTDTRYFLAQLISVRCHLSSNITFARTGFC